MSAHGMKGVHSNELNRKITVIRLPGSRVWLIAYPCDQARKDKIRTMVLVPSYCQMTMGISIKTLDSKDPQSKTRPPTRVYSSHPRWTWARKTMMAWWKTTTRSKLKLQSISSLSVVPRSLAEHVTELVQIISELEPVLQLRRLTT